MHSCVIYLEDLLGYVCHCMPIDVCQLDVFTIGIVEEDLKVVQMDCLAPPITTHPDHTYGI